jgi:hypothetical protein
MGGRASLIMVVGFAVIFGIINLNIASLTRRSVGGMVGYSQSALSRIMASSGANVGMAIFSSPGHSTLRGTLVDKNYTTGNFKGGGYTVTVAFVPASGKIDAYIRLRSVSRCTTYVKSKGSSSYFIISDTVEVRMDSTGYKSFSELGWMSVNENGVLFATGDTLNGKVHSNSNINIQSGGTPVFMEKVTTAGVINPATNSAKWLGGPPELHVPTRDFPTDLNNINLRATNLASTQATELYVTLKPGTSADNDGYAIISTVVSSTSTVSALSGYDKWGNPTYTTRTVTNYAPGVKLDSIPTSGTVENVIYTTKNVHVSGTLDGNLSICSGTGDLRIENDILYERPPDPSQPLSATVNQTTDLLGLLAYKNIIVSENTANHLNDLTIDAAMFCLTGSFTAENYDKRGDDGYIRTLGSIAQKIRGPIGTPGTPYDGYHKSYKYDTRFSPPPGATNPDGTPIAKKQPPVFPGYTSKGPLQIKSWWESTRKPFNVDEYNL